MLLQQLSDLKGLRRSVCSLDCWQRRCTSREILATRSANELRLLTSEMPVSQHSVLDLATGLLGELASCQIVKTRGNGVAVGGVLGGLWPSLSSLLHFLDQSVSRAPKLQIVMFNSYELVSRCPE